MDINVHPLLVHFPIAFLTTYSLLELVRIPILTRQTFYFYTKAMILFFGVVTSGFAILAGLLIENQFSDHALVYLHKVINITASIIFLLLALEYLTLWINHNPPAYLKNTKWWSRKVRTANFLIHTPAVFLLTLAGLLLITVGGALGGIIVYGPNLDPFTQFVASIFGVM